MRQIEQGECDELHGNDPALQEYSENEISFHSLDMSVI